MDILARERSLISDEKLHTDWERPWWDSPESQSDPEGGGASIAGKCPERSTTSVTDELGLHCWSPLSAVDMEHIYQEANRLARQLHRVAVKEALVESPLVASLRREKALVRSPRRKTYVVKDSPVRVLLPDISLEDDLLPHMSSDGAAATPTGNKDIPPPEKNMPSESMVIHFKDENTPADKKATSIDENITPSGDSATPSHCTAASTEGSTTPVRVEATVTISKAISIADKRIPAGSKDFVHREMYPASGEEVTPSKDNHTAARDKPTFIGSKTTSGVAALRLMVPGRGRGVEPNTHSLRLKQRDPRSFHAPQKKEPRGSQVLAPPSHRSSSCLPRTSHKKEPVGRLLTDSRLLAKNATAPGALHTVGKLPGHSAPEIASTQDSRTPVSFGVLKPAMGQSLSLTRTLASEQGLHKVSIIPVTQQRSGMTGTRTTPGSSTAGKRAAPSSGTTGTRVAPSSGTTGTRVAPSNGTTGTRVAPSSGTTGARVAPSSGTTGTRVAPSSGTTGTRVAPSSGTTGTRVAPSSGTAGMKAATGNGTSKAKMAPGSSRPQPKQTQNASHCPT